MKKSLIWLLTAVMAVTFGSLLYFQIMYLENMIDMREEQFSNNVMHSLHSTVGILERYETLNFLEDDVMLVNYSAEDNKKADNDIFLSQNHEEQVNQETVRLNPYLSFPSPTQAISERFRSMRETLKNQYQYQQGLLNEVVLTILRDAPLRPLNERADSALIRKILNNELEFNGVDLEFSFGVASAKNSFVYTTTGFINPEETNAYSADLFPNTGSDYKLYVEFPTRDSYIFSSVRFIIPTLVLTAFLLVIFIYTVIMIFRQKKLSEMKTDFINNMTHEFKTPISTISLAAQMLDDESVRKSPSMLKHLSTVIADESKRLRFQVEKVLQLSVYDNAGGSALKFT
ncbi:MAG: two-component sensor histidine kinase, partial [Muribaculaceae bacterium]|nr:two-component sensor histidine kinase [Muribaculaceae bacterium]